MVASSDATLIGRRFEDAALLGRPAGFHRVDGKVAVVDSVPTAHWHVLFAQGAAEFDGGLGKRIDNAVVLVIVSGLLAAAVGFAALLRRLRRAREEQRRLEEINRTTEEFMSIVSHELRTPVAGVLGFLQTTADHWTIMSSDEQRQAVERALANARRLHLFSQEILDTARLDRGRLVGDLEVIDLRGELDASVATARTLSPERLIALWMPDEPVWVKADPNRLRQVFSNLEDNAVEPLAGLLTGDGADGDRRGRGRRPRGRRGPGHTTPGDGTDLRTLRARPRHHRGRDRARPAHRPPDRRRPRRDHLRGQRDGPGCDLHRPPSARAGRGRHRGGLSRKRVSVREQLAGRRGPPSPRTGRRRRRPPAAPRRWRSW